MQPLVLFLDLNTKLPFKKFRNDFVQQKCSKQFMPTFQIVVAWIPVRKNNTREEVFCGTWHVAPSQPKNIVSVYSSRSQEEHEAVNGYPTFIQWMVRMFKIDDCILKRL